MPSNKDQSSSGELRISTCLVDLTSKIDQLIASHKELAENIAKLKEAVYNPDEGIYARIRELEREIIKGGEVRMAKVEETVAGVKKIQWMIIGSTVAAIVAVLFKTLST
jgi:predicted neutral ceramidase superfamily lipid hydrolase